MIVEVKAQVEAAHLMVRHQVALEVGAIPGHQIVERVDLPSQVKVKSRAKRNEL